MKNLIQVEINVKYICKYNDPINGFSPCQDNIIIYQFRYIFDFSHNISVATDFIDCAQGD